MVWGRLPGSVVRGASAPTQVAQSIETFLQEDKIYIARPKPAGK
jgi:hypothetical protein